MPRAPILESFTEAEFRLSREYLKGALPPFIGNAKLAESDNKKWLVNSASGSTYGTYMIGRPDPQLGMVRIVFDLSGNPLHGVAGATWIILHDPHLNKAWMLTCTELNRWMSEVYRNPQYQSAMMRVRAEQSSFQVLINLDWAASVKLVRSAVDLPKGEFLKWRDKKLAAREDFCHLHNHSTYSLLDGVSTIEAIADQAMLNGQPGIALTDHGNVFGAFKHWAACKERGIKPIVGCEIYLVDDVSRKYVHNEKSRRFEYHQTVIATNEIGWKNLCKLLTAAARDHFHFVPRIDHNMLLSNSEGLIVLSGCFKGMVAHYLQERPLREGETDLPDWYKRYPDRSRNFMRMYKQALGDRYYVEIQPIDYAPYVKVIPEILDMARSEGVPVVITNDNHYPRPEDAILQAAMTKISNTKVDGLGESMMEKGVYYIRSKAEMQAGVNWTTEDMFARSVEIMNRCDLGFDRKEYLFPKYEMEKDVDWSGYQASKGKVVSTPQSTDFDGDTYIPENDEARLGRQMQLVYSVMKDGCWRTPEELHALVGSGTTASLTSRLRDLRKTKFGGMTVTSRRRGSGGSWEYQVTPGGVS